MDILYVKCEKNSLSSSSMLHNQVYDAIFFDNFGEDCGLKACLESVQRGDTIHVERSSFLADSFLEGAEIFCELSSRGVNVWVDSSKSFLDCEDFHLVREDLPCVLALIDLRNDYTKERQREGYQRLRDEGRRTKRQQPLPPNFHPMRKAWNAGELSCVVAAQLCGMPTSTFWSRVKQYEAEHRDR